MVVVNYRSKKYAEQGKGHLLLILLNGQRRRGGPLSF